MMNNTNMDQPPRLGWTEPDGSTTEVKMRTTQLAIRRGVDMANANERLHVWVIDEYGYPWWERPAFPF